MEFEGFKTAWQKRSLAGHPHASPLCGSRSLQFVRTGAIRDLQRSDELSRFVVSLLFALIAVGVSLIMMAPGAGRIAAWLFALALVIDGAAGVALFALRYRGPASTSMLDFISREHRQIETRIRIERYTQPLMLLCAAAALLLMLFSPSPADIREASVDVLARMGLLTGFLAVAWKRVKSGTREIRRELEHYLRDFER